MSERQRDGFVQELRGVAVLLVIAYHFFDYLMPLGYLGVDLFFGISGFVITSSIVSRREYSLRGLGDFYARRVKRLLPSLYFTILVTLLAVFLLFSPKLQRSVAIESVAATFALSNVYFYNTIDYFSGSTILRPLLHTWSLSLEEQVYLFFPAALAFFYSSAFKGKIYVPTVLVGISILFSLIYFFQLNVSEQRLLGFYSPVSRFWQFGVGALVALLGLRALWGNCSLDALRSLALLAFLPIVLVFLGLLNEKITNREYMLSVAASGACVCLLCLASRESYFPWLRKIGDRSYSLYLWHWPIYVLVSYVNNYIYEVRVSFLSVVLTVLMSEFTYRYLERDHQNKKYLLPGLLTLMLVNILVAAGVYWTSFEIGQGKGGLEQRAPCLVKSQTTWEEREALGCLSKNSGPDAVYLWGSSHLAHYQPALSELISLRPIQKVLTQGCPPVPRLGSASCQSFNDYVLSKLLLIEGGKVIVGGNWENHWSDSDFYKSFELVVSELTAAGLEVIVFGQIPTFAVDIPTYVNANPTVEYLKTASSSRLQTRLQMAVERNGGRFINLQEKLCRGDACLIQQSGRVLYEDETHLSIFGAEMALKDIGF